VRPEDAGGRLERARSSGARGWEGWEVEVVGRERLEASCEGGPRKREGGGARWGWGAGGEVGESEDMVEDESETIRILIHGCGRASVVRFMESKAKPNFCKGLDAAMKGLNGGGFVYSEKVNVEKI